MEQIKIEIRYRLKWSHVNYWVIFVQINNPNEYEKERIIIKDMILYPVKIGHDIVIYVSNDIPNYKIMINLLQSIIDNIDIFKQL